MAQIYALRCPTTGDVRYIGKANCAKARYKRHLRDATRRRTPVYDWIISLGKDGLAPVLDVLLECDEWQAEERRVIREHREAGARLLNVADGGDEPFCPSSVRAANGKASAIKRASTPEKRLIWSIKRSLGSALKAGYISAETRAKMRLAAVKHPKYFGEWVDV